MSTRKFEMKDLIDGYAEAFIEGYKFSVETLAYLIDNIDKKHNAKHKKILNTVQEDLQACLATLGKDVIRTQAEKFLEGRAIVEKIMNKKHDESPIIKPNTKIIKP